MCNSFVINGGCIRPVEWRMGTRAATIAGVEVGICKHTPQSPPTTWLPTMSIREIACGYSHHHRNLIPRHVSDSGVVCDVQVRALQTERSVNRPTVLEDLHKVGSTTDRLHRAMFAMERPRSQQSVSTCQCTPQ